MDDNLNNSDNNITETDDKSKCAKSIGVVFDTLEMIIYALIAACMVFVFVARIATVDGESMVPTLSDSDRLLISNICYEPERGDIVVIMPYEGGYGKALVKRIIGLPGDNIDINFQNGDVYVNGEVIEEPYINDRTYASSDVIFPLTVPEGSVFVMGDNRNRSLDSRDTRVGFVNENAIMGKVVERIYPFKKIENK